MTSESSAKTWAEKRRTRQRDVKIARVGAMVKGGSGWGEEGGRDGGGINLGFVRLKAMAKVAS